MNMLFFKIQFSALKCTYQRNFIRKKQFTGTAFLDKMVKIICDTNSVVKLIKCECKNPWFYSRQIRCDLSLV